MQLVSLAQDVQQAGNCVVVLVQKQVHYIWVQVDELVVQVLYDLVELLHSLGLVFLFESFQILDFLINQIDENQQNDSKFLFGIALDCTCQKGVHQVCKLQLVIDLPVLFVRLEPQTCDSASELVFETSLYLVLLQEFKLLLHYFQYFLSQNIAALSIGLYNFIHETFGFLLIFAAELLAIFSVFMICESFKNEGVELHEQFPRFAQLAYLLNYICAQGIASARNQINL